jgi:hypothetical protein
VVVVVVFTTQIVVFGVWEELEAVVILALYLEQALLGQDSMEEPI